MTVARATDPFPCSSRCGIAIEATQPRAHGASNHSLLDQNNLDPAIGSGARIKPGKRLIRAISDHGEA